MKLPKCREPICSGTWPRHEWHVTLQSAAVGEQDTPMDAGRPDPGQAHRRSTENCAPGDLLSAQSAVTGLLNGPPARDSDRPAFPSADFALPTLPEHTSAVPLAIGQASRPVSSTSVHRAAPGESRPCSPPFFASTPRPSSTRNIIVAAGDDSQIITLSQVLSDSLTKGA